MVMGCFVALMPVASAADSDAEVKMIGFQTSVAEDGKYSLRMIGSVSDQTNVVSAGFILTVNGGEERTVYLEYAYQTISTDFGNDSYSAPEGGFLGALAIHGCPIDTEFTAKFFVEYRDGTVITSEVCSGSYDTWNPYWEEIAAGYVAKLENGSTTSFLTLSELESTKLNYRYKNGDKITLLTDVTCKGGAQLTGASKISATLDLNGKTLTLTSGCLAKTTTHYDRTLSFKLISSNGKGTLNSLSTTPLFTMTGPYSVTIGSADDYKNGNIVEINANKLFELTPVGKNDASNASITIWGGVYNHTASATDTSYFVDVYGRSTESSTSGTDKTPLDYAGKITFNNAVFNQVYEGENDAALFSMRYKKGFTVPTTRPVVPGIVLNNCVVNGFSNTSRIHNMGSLNSLITYNNCTIKGDVSHVGADGDDADTGLGKVILGDGTTFTAQDASFVKDYDADAIVNFGGPASGVYLADGKGLTTNGNKHTVGTGNDNAGDEVKHMLDGKKIIFIGDSFIYYGQVVLNGSASRYNDKGYFYQLCKSMGAEVSVTNWTYSATNIHVIYDEYTDNLSDLNYDYVVISGGRNSTSKAEDYFITLQNYMTLFRSGNPNVKFLYLVSSGAHNISTFETFPVELLNNLKEFEEMGFTIVDWGKLVSDIIRGNVAVPNSEKEYNKNSFIVHKSSEDGYHPNQLAGYITALMTYCAITGESAVDMPYDFWNDTTLNAKFNTDTYISTYYTKGTTNYTEIFGSPEDMRGLQTLIDQYYADKAYRDYQFSAE